MAILAIWYCACSQDETSQKNDDTEFTAFREQQIALLNKGVLKDHRDLIRTTDSFYLLKHNVSPYFLPVIYVSKSRDYMELGEYDSSNMFADRALAIIEKYDLQKNNPSDYINALTLKGQASYAVGHFTKAYNYYFKAKQLSEQLNDSCSSNEFNYRLAMIAYKQKNYLEAANNFKRSFIAAAGCKKVYTYLLQENLDNIGLCYEKAKMPDSALYFYDSAASFIIKYAATFPSALLTEKALAVVYGNLGGLYLSLGKTDTGIALLKKSYSINIRYKYDNTDALLTHLKLANAYLEKKDMALLSASIEGLRKELDTINHPLEAKANWHKLMFAYSELQHNEDEAFAHYREYTTLRDSLWELEKKQLKNDLSRELKEKEQEKEITLLLKQNQLNSLYLWVSAGAAILLLIIIALIYANYRRSKRNVRILKNLNDHINLQKKQLATAADELGQSNRNKDKILHIVAHDLRSPINGIIGLSGIIKDQATLSAEQKELLNMIINTSNSALALIGELLEYKMDNAKGIDNRKARVDLNELVQSVTDILRFKAEAKNQKIIVTAHATPLMVEVNAEKIKRVLNNLVTNASKFSPENTSIYLALTQQEDRARIEIQDNGIGIPDKFKPMVFEPFTSAKRYGTAGEESFGLGLSICKQIAEANGGNIWFESTEGKGTSFFVEFPLSMQQ
jgi:signal transduction histidine kinase